MHGNDFFYTTWSLCKAIFMVNDLSILTYMLRKWYLKQMHHHYLK